ncbi:MAG: spore photoproduct lyase [Clostridia bacterium]|nr:spore photoproduct lyase [Clostridia bacterium]
MQNFIPQRVYIEPAALEYPLGKHLYEYFKSQGIPTKYTTSHNRVVGIPGKTPPEAFREAKNTLVIGIRKSKKFETCRPSAHFQLPLVTGCPGKCEYCYLATNLGRKPYIRVYVNVGEILSIAKDYMEQRKPEITLFEGAATSDPLPVEAYTGSLKKTIEFFSDQQFGRFRFVTKFTNVDSLLPVEHKGKTHFRFSINLPEIINTFEHGTPTLEERLKAAEKVSRAGYPLGIMIAPIFLEGSWQDNYFELLKTVKKFISDTPLSFELITHRFTKRAKSTILDIFPGTQLSMDEEKRRFKYGQFGYGKYLYPKDLINEAKEFFMENINSLFKDATVEYFV